MRKLTKEEASQVSAALARARAGRASAAELGAALDLAAAGGLPGCAGELRGHLLKKLGAGPARGVGRDVAIGLATGAATHFILRGR